MWSVCRVPERACSARDSHISGGRRPVEEMLLWASLWGECSVFVTASKEGTHVRCNSEYVPFLWVFGPQSVEKWSSLKCSARCARVVSFVSAA